MTVEHMPRAFKGPQPLQGHEILSRNFCAPLIDTSLPGKSCALPLEVGIFFDGTNNNRQRDKLDVLAATGDPDKCSHSNVAVLYDLHQDKVKDGYARIYVPGVGTKFEEIGEFAESPEGKSQGLGGDARITWALLQLMNAMHFRIWDRPMFTNSQVLKMLGSRILHLPGGLDFNLQGKLDYLCESDDRGGHMGALSRALTSRNPMRLGQLNLSVFGFSRGAAQARAFCHFLQHLIKPNEENVDAFAGVSIYVRFLGLFDTVASVGLADSSPAWRGLGGWANGTLNIAPCVARTVHLVAGHEIRQNFPLSSARSSGSYSKNVVERVYPGAHSDVGGGYRTSDQGKSPVRRSRLLSQIPLNDMYHEALAVGVALLMPHQLDELGDPGDALKEQLTVEPDAVTMFNAYRDWGKVADNTTVENALELHMQSYWYWRLSDLIEVEPMIAYKHMSEQDRIDMTESENDFLSDAKKAHELSSLKQPASHHSREQVPPQQVTDLTKAHVDFLEQERLFRNRARPISQDVDGFFDCMVHDSHASFYMVGPVTLLDRIDKVEAVKAKQRRIAAQKLEAAEAANRALPGEPTPLIRVDTLSSLEQRILDHQREHPGEFPSVTDADRRMLLDLENLTTRGAVQLVTRDTRREMGGHVRYRRVFDAC